MVSDESEAQKKAFEQFKLAASELKGKIFFSVSHFADELGQRLGEFIGVTEADCPTVKLLKNSQYLIYSGQTGSCLCR